MKKYIITFFFSLFLFSANIAHASFNNEINYQGRLTTPTGIAVPNGNYNIQFNLYTVPTGGSPIWTETDCYSVDNGNTCTGSGTDQRVTITNGLFSVMLGSTTPFTGVNFNQTLYLGVNIGGSSATPSYDGEMTPRKILGAVPAAMYAGTSTVALTASTLNGVTDSQFFRNDVLNSTSSATTSLSITQLGSGKIAEFFGSSSQSVLSILSNGNIGIGSSTPGSLLTVMGNGYFGGSVTVTGNESVLATTTTNGLIISNLSNTFLAVDSYGNVIATTTPNSVNFWTNSGSNTFLNTGSNISFGTFFASSSGGINAIAGALAIGTTTPFAQLSIQGIYGSSTPLFSIASTTSSSFATSSLFTVLANGNVGIGTTTPIVPLDIVGQINLEKSGSRYSQLINNSNNFEIIPDQGRQYQFSDSAFWQNGNFSIYGGAGVQLTFSTADYFTGGNVGVGTSTPSGQFSIQGIYGSSTPLFTVASTTSSSFATTSVFQINSNGNVGVGTSTPGSLLTLNGGNITMYNPGNGGTNFVTFYSTGNLTNAGIGNSNGNLSTGNNFTIQKNSPSSFSFVNGAASLTYGSLGIDANSNVVLTQASSTRGISLTGGNGVAIGTTTPFAQLSIQGIYGSSTPLFSIASTTSSSFATTSVFQINSNGNVGVGTTTPGSLLSVAGDTASNDFIVSSTTIPAGGNGINLYNAAGITLGIFSGGNETAGFNLGNITEVGNPLSSSLTRIIVNNNNNHSLQMGVTGTTYSGTTFVSDEAYIENNATANGLFLGTTNNTSLFLAASNTVAMTINSANNIGIGTTTPFAQLSIQGIYGSSNSLFSIASTTSSSFATTSLFSVSSNGTLGIGTSTTILSDANGNLTFSDSPINGTIAFQINGTNRLSINGGTGVTAYGSIIPPSTNAYSVGLLSKVWAASYIQSGYFTNQLTVGTTTPFAQLSIQGIYGSSTPLFSIASTTSSGFATSSLFTVLANGNVGIGTTTPIVPLDIVGQINLEKSGSNYSQLIPNGNNFEIIPDQNRQYYFSDGGITQNGSFSINEGSGPKLYFNQGADYFTGGNVGVGTSTPSGQFSIQGIYGSSIPLFTVASTTSSSFATSSVFQINSNGNVGIGTTTPSTTLDVAGNITDESVKGCDSSSQAIGTDANGVMVCDSSLSDERLKNNITSLDGQDALTLIDSLNPVSFYWKDPSIPGTGSTQQQFGFIAQQVSSVAPNLVGTTSPTYLTPDQTYYLNYQGIIAPLVKAVQQQQLEIDAASSTIVASTTAATLSTSSSFIQTIANAVVALLQSGGQGIQSAGNWVMDKLSATVVISNDIQTNTLETQSLTTQTASVSDGLEMTDQTTGYIYCVRLLGGQFAKTLGTCVSAASSTPIYMSTPTTTITTNIPSLDSVPAPAPQLSSQIVTTVYSTSSVATSTSVSSSATTTSVTPTTSLSTSTVVTATTTVISLDDPSVISSSTTTVIPISTASSNSSSTSIPVAVPIPTSSPDPTIPTPNPSPTLGSVPLPPTSADNAGSSTPSGN